MAATSYKVAAKTAVLIFNQNRRLVSFHRLGIKKRIPNQRFFLLALVVAFNFLLSSHCNY
jgi:hypothetical protein